MSSKYANDAIEQAVTTAERIEDMDSVEDLDILEHRISASLDGTAREVVAVLTTGGPHVEVNLSTGTVTARWGGDSHTTHVDADAVLGAAEDWALTLWETAEPKR